SAPPDPSSTRNQPMRRIALATWCDLPELSEDDQLLLAPLEQRGIRAEPVVWNDPGVTWDRFEAVVVRSCWDYHHRHDDFLEWTESLERLGVPLWNPALVLRWNAEKSYLNHLQNNGIPVVPTRWIEAGSGLTLAVLMEETGWDDVVVKPTISASAHNTWRTSRTRAAKDGARFGALAARSALMLQPFVDEVASEGEWSLVFLGGAFSHAVMKRPRPGDFRVQPEHGGTVDPVEAGAELINAAQAALQAIPGEWLYARVDGCLMDGRFCITEVELVEPSLFLITSPGAPDRAADAIEAALGLRPGRPLEGREALRGTDRPPMS
ncbi:MAG: ATP-grasp domain-containing protein, partial [Gemmatimonadales bacterium]